MKERWSSRPVRPCRAAKSSACRRVVPQVDQDAKGSRSESSGRLLVPSEPPCCPMSMSSIRFGTNSGWMLTPRSCSRTVTSAAAISPHETGHPSREVETARDRYSCLVSKCQRTQFFTTLRSLSVVSNERQPDFRKLFPREKARKGEEELGWDLSRGRRTPCTSGCSPWPTTSTTTRTPSATIRSPQTMSVACG